MVGGRLNGNFVRHLRSASTAPRDLQGERAGTCGRRRSSEVQRGRIAGRFRGDTGGQRSGCDRPLVGSAAAARLGDCRIRGTDGAVGQRRGRDGKAAGGCRPDDNLVGRLRSGSTASPDPHGERVGTCGRRCSSEVERGRVAGRFRGDTGGQRSGYDRPFVGSAAAARLYGCRICAADSVIGQRGRGDGDVAKAARAKEEEKWK